MRIVIIGAGVAGLSIGWRLRQAGAEVTILERAQAAQGATWASAGMIAIAGAGLAFAFALAEPDRALAAMFLMFGLVARTAADAIAPTDTGLIGKIELFVAFAVACLFPRWFSIVAYAFGILCFVAAGSRVASAAQRI